MAAIVGGFFKLAAWVLIQSRKSGATRAATGRITSAVLCAGLGGVLALAALGCAAVSLWNYALPSLGPVGAPLVVAAALSITALVLALASWRILCRRRPAPGVDMAPQLLLNEARRLFGEHKSAMLLAALIAGMAAANSGRKL
jgi:hypothetical protein